MRTPSRPLLLALGPALISALACASGGDDDTGNVVLPVVHPLISGPEPLFQRVAPGETAAVEWTVTWPDGERPAHVAFDIGALVPSLDAEAPLRGGWVEGRSRYRLEFTATARGAHSLALSPFACATTVCEPVAHVPAEVQVAGGPADAVFPPLAADSLAVGEVRPMTAFAATAWEEYAANPNPNFGERFWSDDPLAWSVDDPSVASVDADGVLTGVSAGVTTLRIRAGEAEATVALTVADAPLGPPQGEVPVADHLVELYEPGWAAGVGPIEGKVAVDARGWPMIVVPMRSGFGPDVDPPFITQQPPLALARWTGTGFGWEWLGEPAERNFHGAVTVDADGHLWVVLRDRLNNELELWDRPGDVVVGGWRKRVLPIGVDVGAGEVDMTWFSEGYNNGEYDDYFPVAMRARPEGGVHLAYASWQDYNNPDAAVPWSEQCPRMLRLVTATEAGLEVEEVERSWLLTVQTQNGCDDVFGRYGASYLRLVLLPSDGARPTIRALQAQTSIGQPGNLWAWRHESGGWEAEVTFMEGPITDYDAADIAPILPVASAEDWVVIDDDGDGPLWAWRDASGAVRADDPLADGSAGEIYAGHAVGEERVHIFVSYEPNRYDATFVLHSAER